MEKPGFKAFMLKAKGLPGESKESDDSMDMGSELSEQFVKAVHRKNSAEVLSVLKELVSHLSHDSE